MNRTPALIWMALCALLLVGLRPLAKAQDDAADAAGAALPRAETPVKSATLEQREGRPTVVLNGVDAMPYVAYCNAILSPPNWAKWNADFAALDVDVFFLSVTPWMQVYEAAWSDEGMAAYVPGQDPKPLSLEAQVAAILAMKPDARFVVRWGVTPGKAWQEAHPDELQLAEGGKRYPEASLGSALFREDLVAFMKRLVHHIEDQPWAERVISYVVFPLGEGITPLTIDGYFYDRSPAMVAAWREHEGVKAAPFPSEAATREALEGRLVFDYAPADPHERYVRWQRHCMYLWSKAILDGLEYATNRRPVLTGLDALKLPMLGWQLRESFEAEDHGPQHYDIVGVSGPSQVRDLLHHRGLDVLVTPADYHARGVGMGWDGEGLGDPLVLLGKTLIIENDARTWLATEARGRAPLGAFMTPQETRAGLLRNTGMAMSRGFMHYWMDISNGFFRDPQVQAGVATDRDALRTLSATPHRDTEHAIAVVIDEAAILDTNFTSGFHNLAIIRQRIDALAISGIPYRVHLLNDLRGKVPDYRCWYFPNLTRLESVAEGGSKPHGRVRANQILQEKVLRNGNIAIFGPATGITDALKFAREVAESMDPPLARGPSRRYPLIRAKAAEDLLGIPMAVFPGSAPRRVRLVDRGHPALQATGVPPIYGDSYPYGPILLPDRERFPEAIATAAAEAAAYAAAGPVANHAPQILGEGQITWRANGPGLVLREFGRGARGNGVPGERGEGDYATVFSAALPIPGPLLRGLARYGGCNVWCDADVVLSASDSMVSLHSTEPGPFTLHLPRRVPEVRDALSGEIIARNVETLVITLSPPETRIFTLSPPPPASAEKE